MSAAHLRQVEEEEHRGTSGKRWILQLSRVNAKSSRYTMDILAGMKCVSVCRILGSLWFLCQKIHYLRVCARQLRSCLRRDKPWLSVSFFCSSKLYSLTFATLALALLLELARTMHPWNHCVQLFLMNNWSKQKHTHSTTFYLFPLRDKLFSLLHKKSENHMGTV